MEIKVSEDLIISISSEPLSAETEEERPTSGQFCMIANEHLLSAGEDTVSGELRHGPYVSGYPIGMWFAWNWWRLRWEANPPEEENARCRWEMAHRMSGIGEGYVWPNVTISPDGRYLSLMSEPSQRSKTTLFQYVGAPGIHMVKAKVWETAIDTFVEGVLTRLDNARRGKTKLHHHWADIKREREDPDLTRFRRLEAQLGHEPDEIDENTIHSCLKDSDALGDDAMGEIALDAARGGQRRFYRADELIEIAKRTGLESNPRDSIALDRSQNMPIAGDVEAWKLGQDLARAVRDQVGLNGTPIADRALEELAGTKSDAASGRRRNACGISFALDDEDGGSRISFRTPRKTGRRFDLARLVGDRLFQQALCGPEERLLPATRAFSYRQKMQRAFAAELLSPLASVEDIMGGDYSEDMQNKVARHFSVSPLAIQTQLLNNRKIDRVDAPDLFFRIARL